MTKTPAFQFYTGDWLKDPQLSMCSPITRGIWMDLICAMHENDRTGQITGTTTQLVRLCRCNAVELDAALIELSSTKTADVTNRNGKVTIICRRMKREYNERINTNLRVKHYREKINVTQKKQKSNNVSSTSSSSSITNNKEKYIKRKNSIKKKFGAKVKLIEEEYQRLVSDYGEQIITQYIEKMNEYCQIHGKTYKDCNLAIRNWLNNAGIDKNTEQCQTLGKHDEESYKCDKCGLVKILKGYDKNTKVKHSCGGTFQKE